MWIEASMGCPYWSSSSATSLYASVASFRVLCGSASSTGGHHPGGGSIVCHLPWSSFTPRASRSSVARCSAEGADAQVYLGVGHFWTSLHDASYLFKDLRMNISLRLTIPTCS